jgi:hypothetical protein
MPREHILSNTPLSIKYFFNESYKILKMPNLRKSKLICNRAIFINLYYIQELKKTYLIIMTILSLTEIITKQHTQKYLVKATDK